jgi:hypothetical protein
MLADASEKGLVDQQTWCLSWCGNLLSLGYKMKNPLRKCAANQNGKDNWGSAPICSGE